MIVTVCTAGTDHSSVDATTSVANPPEAKAAVLVPAGPIRNLAVFKSFTSVQLVPFQDSVTAVGDGLFPPKANAAV